MPERTPARRRAYSLAAVSVLALVAGAAALAETLPTLNFYGATGLMDMPSGEAQADAALSTSSAHFGPVSRTTLSFQVSPRLSASFRFLAVRDWNVVPQGDETDQFDIYYDRSFDLRYQVLTESRYVPAVTVGFQDFVGTGILQGEYVAATKHILPNVKVTAGLGWGRLGSYGDIGSPFGERPRVDVGEGGNFNVSQFFRGPAAPFGGIEWQINDKWGVKAEYSSDGYLTEAGARETFDRKSPFNFGVEYQAGRSLRIGGYYMYGSEVGIAAHYVANPKERSSAIFPAAAPVPVGPRVSIAADPEAWSTDWVSQPGGNAILRTNLGKQVADDGILVEALGFTGTTAQVRIRNIRYDAEAQAIGRVARAMAIHLPPSVEVFEIVPVVNGMPASKVTLRRSDLETLEFAPNASDAIRAKAVITAPGRPIEGLTYDEALYPRFSWSVGQHLRYRLFDQKKPIKLSLGLRATARYELRQGLYLNGSVTKGLIGNLDDRPPLPDRGSLQPVRSAVYFYDAEGDPELENLSVNWYGYLGRDFYGRVSAGYLERMFGGISTEVLWKPVGRRWALGAEVNYVAQRAPDDTFGFTLPQSMYETDSGPVAGASSYRVASGHVSGYFDLGNGFHAQLDVGRYLAGDVGATITLDREFANGWKVGAFATKTNVSAEDFGSGSFDKGIRLEIPFATVVGKPTRRVQSTVLRPFGRDGGARLDVPDRLYETVRDYHESGLDNQWGRFWK